MRNRLVLIFAVVLVAFFAVAVSTQAPPAGQAPAAGRAAMPGMAAQGRPARKSSRTGGRPSA